jgi:hypothetical protein
MPAPLFQGRLLIAGATGALGNEVLGLLVGRQRYRDAQVLAREPITAGLRGVHAHVVPGDEPARWPLLPNDTAVVMFEPARPFYQRERALWTPLPEQLPALAQWLRACGTRTLAIVMPHTQMRLPEALKHGLATLDEHAVAALGFERVLIVRTARKPGEAKGGSLPARLARVLLSVGKYMVPNSEQPVRATKVAQFVASALELAPRGIHVAAPQVIWQAAQGDVHGAVIRWLAA